MTGVGSSPPTLERVLIDIQRQLELSRVENQTLRQQVTGLAHRLDHLQQGGVHSGSSPRGGNSTHHGIIPGVSVLNSSLVTAHQLAIPLAAPERFAGDPQKLNIFLTQCRLHFLCRPAAFPTQESRVDFVLSYLTRDAALWSIPLVSGDHPMLYQFDQFEHELRRIFDRRTVTQSVDNELLELRQGNRDLLSYLAHFNRLVVESDWPEAKRASVFYRGLRDDLKDMLSQVVNRPTECDALIDLVLQLDHHLTECKGERRRSEVKASIPSDRSGISTGNGSSEPMQIGAVRPPLSKLEKEKRRQGN